MRVCSLVLLSFSDLQEFGIAAADIKKLRENGIHSVEALAHRNKRDLVLMKGLSEAKVDKMQKECKQMQAVCSLRQAFNC